VAVDIDSLIAPLVPAQVRGDLITLATLIGLTISVRPSDPTFQIVDWLAKWFCFYWNTYAIPGLRGQFGATAAGQWLTAWAMARGIARPLASFASGVVTFENRSAGFVDVSAPGAVSITTAAGFTFTSTGPSTGSTGTMGAAVGATYLQTSLIMSCTQVGAASNTAAGSLSGYPAALASGPAGVYVTTGSSSPPAANGALLGSNAMLDPALYQLVLASQATTAAPGAPLAKYVATALLATLPGGIPVATSRVRPYGAGGVVNVACATPSGPTPGSLGTPGSELYQINAAVQLACSQPGMSITVAAAASLAIDLGAVTLYVAAESAVSAAQAAATANAAFALWQSLLPIGGECLVTGGQGYALLNSIVAAFQSQINATYPAQWAPVTYYAAGAQVSNNAQTFVAISPGTSSSLVGPSDLGGADGNSGLVWSPTTGSGGAAQFQAAPGVFEVSIGGISVDQAMAVNNVAVFSYSLSVNVVPQH
jgi:hypothetical protein